MSRDPRLFLFLLDSFNFISLYLGCCKILPIFTVTSSEDDCGFGAVVSILLLCQFDTKLIPVHHLGSLYKMLEVLLLVPLHMDDDNSLLMLLLLLSSAPFLFSKDRKHALQICLTAILTPSTHTLKLTGQGSLIPTCFNFVAAQFFTAASSKEEEEEEEGQSSCSARLCLRLQVLLTRLAAMRRWLTPMPKTT